MEQDAGDTCTRKGRRASHLMEGLIESREPGAPNPALSI